MLYTQDDSSNTQDSEQAHLFPVPGWSMWHTWMHVFVHFSLVVSYM